MKKGAETKQTNGSSTKSGSELAQSTKEEDWHSTNPIKVVTDEHLRYQTELAKRILDVVRESQEAMGKHHNDQTELTKKILEIVSETQTDVPSKLSDSPAKTQEPSSSSMPNNPKTMDIGKLPMIIMKDMFVESLLFFGVGFIIVWFFNPLIGIATILLGSANLFYYFYTLWRATNEAIIHPRLSLIGLLGSISLTILLLVYAL